MAPSKAPAAQPGVRTSHEEFVRLGLDLHLHDGPVSVLLLGKRSTVNAFASRLPAEMHTQDPRPDIALEAQFGSNLSILLTVVTSQRAALQQVRVQPPRAILVELDNRPQSRVRFCRMLRNRVPALAILALADAPPTGAFAFDDFVPLPLTEKRAEAAINRLHAYDAPQVLSCGPFELNLTMRTVDTPLGTRHLTPKLSALLQYFILHQDQVVSRRAIMETVWETTYVADTRTLDVHVRWLRESIELDPSSPEYLLTERGKGYIFRCC